MEEHPNEEMFQACSRSSPREDTEDLDTTNSNNSSNVEIFKMFSCRYCGKKFDRAFSCNRHERVHTGFKPCFCRICGRGFSEPRNLRHHVIRFHSDGSLRHLIKRDRRKRKGGLQFSENSSEDHSMSTGSSALTISPENSSEGTTTNYSESLTKMFTGSLDRKYFYSK